MNKKKLMKASYSLLQILVMPFTAAYAAAAGVFWVYAALIGVCAGLLLVLPGALWAGGKAFIAEVRKTDG